MAHRLFANHPQYDRNSLQFSAAMVNNIQPQIEPYRLHITIFQAIYPIGKPTSP